MENLSRRGFVGTCCACSSASFGWEIVRDSPIVNIVSQTMSKHNSLVSILHEMRLGHRRQSLCSLSIILRLKSMLPGNAKMLHDVIGGEKDLFIAPRI